MKTSDMGQDYFLMFVEGHGEILYQCDFGFVFNQTQCGCVKEGNQDFSMSFDILNSITNVTRCTETILLT